MPYTYIPNLKVLIPRNASRDADALLLAERSDHVNTPVDDYAELWVRDDTLQTPVFTDDAGTDLAVALVAGVSLANGYVPIGTNNTADGRMQGSTLKFTTGQLQIVSGTDSSLAIKEVSALGPTPAATYGYYWVRDDAPCAAMFTNDIGEDLQLLGDPIPLGSWNFRQATISTPGVGQFDTNHADLASTTQLRFVSTGSNEGWVRNWLDELQAPGYIVLRKKGAPAEEVVFSYATITDTASAYSNFNTLVYQNDTTADTAWATDDEWILYVHPTIQTGITSAGTTAQDAALFTERADHVNTPVATKGEIWVRNDSPNTPVFTDDLSNDLDLAWYPRNPRAPGDAMAAAQRVTGFPVQGGTYDSVNDSDLFVVYDRYANHHYMTFFDQSASDIGLAWSKLGEASWTAIDVITTGAVIGQSGGVASDGTNLCVGINGNCYKATTLEPTNVTGGDFTSYAFNSITQCTGIVWDENNLKFIACGRDGTNGYIEWSSDGQTWAVATGGSLGAGIYPRSMDINHLDGHTLVVCGSTSTNTYWSTNATTFTLDTTNNPTTGLNLVYYSEYTDSWMGIDDAATPKLWMMENGSAVNTIWYATGKTCYGLIAGDDLIAYTDDQRTAQQIWWPVHGQAGVTTGLSTGYASYLGIGAGLAFDCHDFAVAGARCKVKPGGGVLTFPRYDDGDMCSLRYGPPPQD